MLLSNVDVYLRSRIRCILDPVLQGFERITLETSIRRRSRQLQVQLLQRIDASNLKDKSPRASGLLASFVVPLDSSVLYSKDAEYAQRRR